MERDVARRKVAASAEAAPTRRGAAGRPTIRRERLPQENREALIIEKAIRFFAAGGFQGNTRDLARSIGISQPLLYHYFPSKQALIERVFEVLYSSRWKPEWEELLRNPLLPLRRRLEEFYLDYVHTVLTPEWTRIFFFAALRDMSIAQRNHRIVHERILGTIVRELRVALGSAADDTPVTPGEEEVAWSLHATIFHLAVRQWILDLPPPIGMDAAIRLEIGLFLHGAGASLSVPRMNDHRLHSVAV